MLLWNKSFTESGCAAIELVMSEYENSRKLAIEAIEKSLDAHENQDFFSIGNDLDEYEVLLDRQEIQQGNLLLLAH